MDTRADHIAQDIKDIAQTRAAIAEKVGDIEQHIGQTMQHARVTMTRLADQTVSTVRHTMQATKEALDPSVHAARHPWAFLGGALFLGYMAGIAYRSSWRHTDGVVPYYPPAAEGAAVMPASASVFSEHEQSGVYPFYPTKPERADRPTLRVELEQAIQDELGLVRHSVIRLGRGLFREMVRQVVPVFVHLDGGSRRNRREDSAHAATRK